MGRLAQGGGRRCEAAARRPAGSVAGPKEAAVRLTWAPILAHGFIDTIGFVSFYLIGPVHGLW